MDVFGIPLAVGGLSIASVVFLVLSRGFTLTNVQLGVFRPILEKEIKYRGSSLWLPPFGVSALGAAYLFVSDLTSESSKEATEPRHIDCAPSPWTPGETDSQGRPVIPGGTGWFYAGFIEPSGD